MSFRFENFEIWKKAMSLGEEINLLADSFPAKERFNLSSQILRAVDSVALNISEGSIEQSDAEFNRFLGYSVRSLAEVACCLHKAKRREYLGSKAFDLLYGQCFVLTNKIIAFKRKLM